MDEDYESGRGSFCSVTTDCEEDCSWCAVSAAAAEEEEVVNHPVKESSSTASSPFGMVWDCLRSVDPLLLLQSSPAMPEGDFLTLMDDIADSVEMCERNVSFDSY
jgi:hypothetical protein